MKKKLLTLAAVFAACIGMQTAQAHLNWECFYVGASGSVDWQRKAKLFNPPTAATNLTFEDVDYNTGGNASLFAGYQWNEWRAELEGCFRHNSNDNIAVNTAGSPEAKQSVGGHSRFWSIMANGYYDIPLEDCFSVYVGVGVGVAFHRFEVDAFTNTLLGAVPKIKDRNTLFAWQVMSGVNYEVNDMLTLFLGYKFFATTKPDSFTLTAGGSTATTTWKHFPYVHGAEAGLRIRL